MHLVPSLTWKSRRRRDLGYGSSKPSCSDIDGSVLSVGGKACAIHQYKTRIDLYLVQTSMEARYR